MSGWAEPGDVMIRAVAAVFALSFGLVGLDFAVEPINLGHELTWLANLLGLPGAVQTEGGALWRALAFGNMAALAVLAARLAAAPRDRTALYAIVASKLTSASAFLILGLDAPAMSLCAAIDLLNLALLWAAFRLSAATRRHDILDRYLLAMGAESGHLEAAMDGLPAHLQPVAATGRLLLSWLGPLLLLGVPRAVGALDTAEFEALLDKLAHHRSPELRQVWMLIRSLVFPRVANV